MTYHRLLRVHCLGLLLLALALLPSVTPTAAANTDIDRYRPHQTTLELPTLEAGTHDGTKRSREGISGDRSTTAAYTTPAQQEAAVFTDLLVRWQAVVPQGAGLKIEIRASLDGTTWTPWGQVIDNEDMHEEGDDVEIDGLLYTTYWGSPLYTGGRAQFWQARASFTKSAKGEVALLRGITVSTVDVGQTPLEKQRPSTTAVESTQSVSRPPVFFRTDWGNPDGEGSRNPPDYYRADHLVVHHTADANSLSSGQSWWGDRVRAIWSFHTYDRGWGDIGYNFLVAPNGQIFEGRAGAYPNFTSDPVGFHDTGNYGSMGVALIGTYSSVPPTSAAQDSLVKILAWKADQRGIDPLGRSYYYGCDISNYCGNSGAITPNIGGHRDVANNPKGYTSCPGDTAYGTLPNIRSRVNALLSGEGGGGGTPDNGDNIIDNLETPPTASGSGFVSVLTNGGSWHESACGDAGNTFWTYTTNVAEESTNAGYWRKQGLKPGSYRIFARIPQGCNVGTATSQARYSVWQGGYKLLEVTRSQNTSADWIELTSGPLTLAASSDPNVTLPVEVHLKDYPGESLSEGRVIYFDSVRFVEEVPQGVLSLQNVIFPRTTISAGEILTMTFVLRNIGNAPLTLPTQAPYPAAPGDPSGGYVYDEGECYLGDSAQTYPSFPKETGRFRVMLGFKEFNGACSGLTGSPETGFYPWRWGVTSDPDAESVTIQPGTIARVSGAVRFRNETGSNRVLTLEAGVVNEFVRYVKTNAFPTTITITPEKRKPLSVVQSAQLEPLAHVYKLKPIPDNFLGRTANPLSIAEGDYVGSFPWDGSRLDWGTGGPFGLSDMFVVQQTRPFFARAEGPYNFELTSDDGAWLWVDGKLVVETHGIHPERMLIGQVYLTPGLHTLSIKYFERGGGAMLHYRWLAALSDGWSEIPTTVGTSLNSGSIVGPGDIILAADDLGGSGVSSISWGFSPTQLSQSSGSAFSLSTANLAAGSYSLYYHATDKLGNAEGVDASGTLGALRRLDFQLDLTPPSSTLQSVTVDGRGIVSLTPTGGDSQVGMWYYRIESLDLDNGAVHLHTIHAGQTYKFFGTPGHRYEFRTMGVDAVGNVEPRPDGSDGTATVPGEARFSVTYLPWQGD